MWETGAWSATVKGQNFGPTPIKDYWSLIREGDDWKIRGLTKAELAAELGANVDGVRAWMTGRTVGRKESVDKIKAFLTRTENAKV